MPASRKDKAKHQHTQQRRPEDREGRRMARQITQSKSPSPNGMFNAFTHTTLQLPEILLCTTVIIKEESPAPAVFPPPAAAIVPKIEGERDPIPPEQSPEESSSQASSSSNTAAIEPPLPANTKDTKYCHGGCVRVFSKTGNLERHWANYPDCERRHAARITGTELAHEYRISILRRVDYAHKKRALEAVALHQNP